MATIRPISFIVLAIASSLISTMVKAQYSDPLETTDVIRISFLSPGFSYEKSTTDRNTLYAAFELTPSFYYRYDNYYGSEASLTIDPAVELHYRWYYNFERRSEKGKRTEMNSANYLAPMVWMVFSKNIVADYDVQETSRRPVTTLGAIWGMQRNYRKNFSLDLQLGVGYNFAKGTSIDGAGNKYSSTRSRYATIADITLGFWLDPKSR